MKHRRLLALVVAIGVLATGPACGKKDADKLMLKKIVGKSQHQSGTYRYSDATPTSFITEGQKVLVRGVIEDDFRFKARVSLNGNDVIEEVVNDDALAVRFLDPTLVNNFQAKGTADPLTQQALESKYWVVDPAGAPSIGQAAVDDRVLGVDPVVDSLSVIDYTLNAIDQALTVERFNEESLDYRPLEDPFPRPPKNGKVVRWDLLPPKLPRADLQDTSGGGGNVKLAKTPVFRKMALYIQDGQLLQIRESIGAEYDLVDDFKTYFLRLAKEGGGETEAQTKEALSKLTDKRQLAQFLFFALNLALGGSGEEQIRPRLMIYEFGDQGEKVKADLPVGADVKKGNLQFFGVNSKKTTGLPPGFGPPGSGDSGGASGNSTVTSTVPADASSSTTVPGDASTTTTPSP